MKKFIIVVEFIIILALLAVIGYFFISSPKFTQVEPYDYKEIEVQEYFISSENFSSKDVVFVKVRNTSGKFYNTAKVTIEGYGFFTYVQYLAPGEEKIISIDVDWNERPTETLSFVVSDLDSFNE